MNVTMQIKPACELRVGEWIMPTAIPGEMRQVRRIDRSLGYLEACYSQPWGEARQLMQNETMIFVAVES